ncbi:RpoE-regulated lipoprotein [Rahnella sp. SAP-1]|uniref:RpoE-regulated lipoprotein n=1 Tax=Rouxiella aceris TaxID=2703884 RepID=A0A848MQ40_9GAMM|nr:RpoE-regulated lipoprotein [Rouxiella aceris]NMP29189.1 RpoE-regulated lipoprotein [Rouxiella aceris]
MTIRPLLLALPLVLSGCSTLSNMSMPHMSWSSLNPMNWFTSHLKVNEQGVGTLTADTPMTEAAVNDGLNGNYHLRSGMSMSDGKMRAFYQAMTDKTVQITVSGALKGKVDRIVVSDPTIESQWGVKIGTPFNTLYSKAFGACQKARGLEPRDVECKAPDSQHVSYIFSGDWQGPEELMPADDALKDWKVSKIVWHAANP